MLVQWGPVVVHLEPHWISLVKLVCLMVHKEFHLLNELVFYMVVRSIDGV